MRGRRLHIAIVDDDESVCTALGRLLSAYSFNIDTFGSAEQFLSSLRVRVPECLILDFHMPDVSGLDLQQHLSRASIKIPTVVITAHNETGLRERCEAAGAAAFLMKPLNDSTLIEAINTAISRQEKEAVPPRHA